MLAMMLAVAVADAAPRSQEAEPPLDMLEFLGSWQTRDGQPVNPFELDDEGVPTSEQERTRSQPGDQFQQGESRQEPTERMRSRPRDGDDQPERPLR